MTPKEIAEAFLNIIPKRNLKVLIQTYKDGNLIPASKGPWWDEEGL